MDDSQLSSGMTVMVMSTAGEAEGHPPLVTLATVVQPAKAPETDVFTDGVPRWWLDVWWGGPDPVAQMYRAAEILGVPALGGRLLDERGVPVATLLASIDNALRNGSYMTGANLAFALLCPRLGVSRDELAFDPAWARSA